jgi:hypothetical protein
VNFSFESDIEKEKRDLGSDEAGRVDDLLKSLESRIDSKLQQIEEREGGISPAEKE